MKNIFKAALLLTGILAGCSDNQNKKTENKVVSVSILPQKYFTEQIAGPEYKINVMIPPGASPASYEPSPRQMQELSNSDLYLRIGEIAFEKAWIQKYQEENSELPFYNVSDDIVLIYAEEDHEHHEENNEHEHHKHEEQHEQDHHNSHALNGHSHTGADPHVWMSPKNAKQIAENTYKALADIYPSDTIQLKHGYNNLLNTITEIDSMYESHMASLKGKDFLIYHPALAYLARDYGMQQHVLEFEGKEPPPSHIAKIINRAREHDIRFIFVQKQFSLDNANSLAREIDAKVVNIDPLNENWPEEMKSILNHLIK